MLWPVSQVQLFLLLGLALAVGSARARALPIEDGILSLKQSAGFEHGADDGVLNQLDGALEEISSVYIRALNSGTHTPELEVGMLGLEAELFDLLNHLYEQQRLAEYMRYEAEVTRQLIVYNMLKKLQRRTL